MRWLLISLALIVGSAQSQETQNRKNSPVEKRQVTDNVKKMQANTKLDISLKSEAEQNQSVTDAVRPVDSCYANCGELKPDPDKDWVHEVRTDPVATFTALLFFATLALWLATRRLVHGAQDTAHKQLRAYLSLMVAGVTPNNADGVPFANLNILNKGQTPAHDVDLASGIYLLPHPLPVNYAFSEMTFQGISTVVQPGDIFSAGAAGTQTLNSAQTSAVQNGSQQRLYVFAIVTYKDIFGCRQSTRLCVSVESLRQNRVDGSWGSYCQHAPIHNEAT